LSSPQRTRRRLRVFFRFPTLVLFFFSLLFAFGTFFRRSWFFPEPISFGSDGDNSFRCLAAHPKVRCRGAGFNLNVQSSPLISPPGTILQQIHCFHFLFPPLTKAMVLDSSFLVFNLRAAFRHPFPLDLPPDFPPHELHATVSAPHSFLFLLSVFVSLDFLTFRPDPKLLFFFPGITPFFFRREFCPHVADQSLWTGYFDSSVSWVYNVSRRFMKSPKQSLPPLPPSPLQFPEAAGRLRKVILIPSFFFFTGRVPVFSPPIPPVSSLFLSWLISTPSLVGYLTRVIFPGMWAYSIVSRIS